MKSVIYVNYSPYENSGKILDYLLNNFERVFLFSLEFHKLGSSRKYNKLLIYRNGKLQEQESLAQIPVPQKIFFLLLPLKSFIIFAQILLHSYRLKKQYGKIDFYFTVNAFTAWIGTVAKKIGLVNKTAFWVWDYYPPIHESKVIMLMRRIYWWFDKVSSHADYVAYVNKKLIDLRKDMGVLLSTADFPVVPIGTDKLNIRVKLRKDLVFGFIGVLKRSHGLDIVFDNADSIMKLYPKACLIVIGSGPDEAHFRERAKKSLIPTKFYGYLKEDRINFVLKKCSIGIATYLPDESNVSHYGDPGKIKRYLQLGLPVISTDILEFSKQIINTQAGIILDYNDPKTFTKSVKKIMGSYTKYSQSAVKLSSQFYYKDIYPALFKHY